MVQAKIFIGLEHLSPDSELDGGGEISQESGSLQTDDVWEEHSRMTYLTPRPPAQAWNNRAN